MTNNGKIDYSNAIIGVALCVFMSVGIIATAFSGTSQACKPAVVNQK